ncbi:hypothetical protein GCM10022239_00610 [Leifsonia bigeumensis]|uniref:Uncharacterized protein n=1 Tax=Leifsonella bigeumensis TaxID=433643 RepID=A0ABP7EYC6_9MICO
MRGHDHPARRGHIIRPVMVGEAPRADEGAAALREGAAHGHGAGAAEWNVAGLEQLDPAGRDGIRLADEFLRLDLEVAHTGMLTRRTLSQMKAVAQVGYRSDGPVRHLTARLPSFGTGTAAKRVAQEAARS